MPKFRKKPVVIEAEHFDGGLVSADGIRDWAASHGVEILLQELDACRTLYIPTLEGMMTAGSGDWIIRGVAGEFYPCKPEIFAATYEAELG